MDEDEKDEQQQDEGQDDKAQQDEQTHEEAAEEMREFEKSDEVPSDLSEWPTGNAKYVTFGEESDEAYGAGPTEKLGTAEVAHNEDGTVTVAGEQVDPADYKGEPIKSGVVEQIEKSKQRYREMQEENPELKQNADDRSSDHRQDPDAGRRTERRS